LRLESIGEIDDIEIISDIKSTTPEATLAALDALSGRRIRLIAGGEDKGLDYSALADALARCDVEIWLISGSATDLLTTELARHGVDWHPADDLAMALDQAIEGSTSGDAVIVSPAAAGFWTSQLEGKPTLRALVRQRQRSVEEAQTS
jgi:UDP-N-acetylmuramoylalanine--D-glutamate ligase